MIRAPVLNRVRLCDPFGTRIPRIDIRGAQVEDMSAGFKIVAPFASGRTSTVAMRRTI